MQTTGAALRILGLIVGGMGIIHAINVAVIGGALGAAFADSGTGGSFVAILEPLAVALFRGGLLVGMGELVLRFSVAPEGRRP